MGIQDALMPIVLLALAIVYALVRRTNAREANQPAPRTGGAAVRGAPASVARWYPLVKQVAAEIEYPFELRWPLAMIWQESTGDKTKRGRDGEVGLMQMMPKALEDVHTFYPSAARRFNIPTNVRELERATALKQIAAGMLYHKLQAKRAGGSLSKATAAYNNHFPPGEKGWRYWRKVKNKAQQINVSPN